MIPRVVASEKGRAQTVGIYPGGVVGLQCGLKFNSGIGLERPIIEGDNPVNETNLLPSSILSTAGPEKSCGNLPAPSGKAKYS